VPLDFEHNTADLDTGAGADGVPNDAATRTWPTITRAPSSPLEQAGTIVDPGAVIVNPSGTTEDGTGIDDTGEAGSTSGGVYLATGRAAVLQRIAALAARDGDDFAISTELAAFYFDHFEPPTAEEGPLTVIGHA
jgi:hypothetical protein